MVFYCSDWDKPIQESFKNAQVWKRFGTYENTNALCRVNLRCFFAEQLVMQ